MPRELRRCASGPAAWHRWLLGSSGAVLLPALAFAAAATTVTQVGRNFSVREAQIKRGGVVRFVNADEFIHHLYVDSPRFHFESEEQPPGEDIQISFPVAGQFDVRCKIHPKMLLRVSVE